MIATKESTRELLGLDKVNQVEYVAIAVGSIRNDGPDTLTAPATRSPSPWIGAAIATNPVSSSSRPTA